jgi:hypothetical protein
MKVTANAVRDGKWWAVEVPDFKGGFHTQAARLDEIPDVVRDAIGMFDGIDAQQVEVEVRQTLAPELAEAVDRAKEARQAAATAATAAAATTRAAAKAAVDAGMAVRDAASLLGLSRQRVIQLLAT